MEFNEIEVIDEGHKIQDTKIGDIIRVLEGDEDREKVYVNYKVTEIYPYQVMAMAKRGSKKRFFSYGELVILGKESQSSELLQKRVIEPPKYGARHNRKTL